MQAKNEVNISVRWIRDWIFDWRDFVVDWRALESKVRDMMKEKQDYKAWYYVPVVKEGYEQKAQFNEDFGKQGYDVKFAPSSKK